MPPFPVDFPLQKYKASPDETQAQIPGAALRHGGVTWPVIGRLPGLSHTGLSVASSLLLPAVRPETCSHSALTILTNYWPGIIAT